MSDLTSDAAKIRNKRLAKLGNPSPAATKPEEAAPQNAESSQPEALKSTEQSPSIPTQNEPRAPRINITNSSISTNPNPFSQLVEQERDDEDPRTGRQAHPSSAPRKQGEGSRPAASAGETIEQWSDRHLSSLFRISLADGAKDGQGHALFYLSDTRAELQETGQPLQLHTTLLDQALVEAASGVGRRSTPLKYLLECWKRICRQFRALKKNGEADRKYQIIKEAKRLCMSYCIFAATLPEMFGLDSVTSNQLTPHLLLDPQDDHGIDHDFLAEAISRFSEDESVKDLLVGAVEDMSHRLSQMTMNDDYRIYVTTLRNLVQYPEMVVAIAHSMLFLPISVTAPKLEKSTLLGPFFAISPLQSAVNRSYFSAPSSRDKTYIFNSQQALRLTLRTHQNELLEITNKFIKTSKETRDRMLDWFAQCSNLNHKRRAIQVDEATVSSDGFMINITVCLDQLCEPFMDASFSKIDRIDINYFRRGPRIDIKEETKLNADQNAAQDFYGKPAEGTNNFISEIFFLTLAAHHYGTEAANQILGRLDKDVKRLKKHLDEIELDREKFVNDPFRLRQFDNAVKKWREQIERGLCRKYALEGVLMDELSQARSMQFMRYVIVWMLRLVDPLHQFPKKPLQLPLPEQEPEAFKCLPEYFLEDVVDNFKFITRNIPQIIMSTQSDELVILCITFLRNSEYIKNPYLKAGLVTILFTGVWPIPNRSKGILGDILNGLPLANEHLLHSVIKFYIEVESTGAHTQFYDKFNIRYEIFQIIKCIWSNTLYRERLSGEAEQNVQFFVRFVNLLLNDVTFVLDESLTAFKEINELQSQLKAGDNLEEDVRNEKQEKLTAAQGKAKSYMQLTNETVAMLKLFTEALSTAFTKPEIVTRLADMLDYNLDTMVGPNARNLRVENPSEYDFQPIVLLSDLVDIYLNLRMKESFVVAVARDGRSYKPQNFKKAAAILAEKGKALKSQAQLKALGAVAEKIRKAKEVDDQAEEDLGDIPDEFLDPILATLMTDPVLLPSSKSIVDRSTIQSILLSDPVDPFNRVPLKIEDVVQHTEMKEKIDAFIAEKKAKRLENSNIMDTTPG